MSRQRLAYPPLHLLLCSAPAHPSPSSLQCLWLELYQITIATAATRQQQQLQADFQRLSWLRLRLLLPQLRQLSQSTPLSALPQWHSATHRLH